MPSKFYRILIELSSLNVESCHLSIAAFVLNRLFTFNGINLNLKTMITNFQKRKLITLFNQHDVDGDGQLEKSDFTGKTDILASVQGFESGSKEYQALCDGFTRFWEGLQTADTTGDGVIGYEEWWAWWDKILSENKYDELLKPIGAMVFSMCSPGEDGYLSKANFLRYYAKQSGSDTDGEEVYSHLTSGGTALINQEKMDELLYDYINSNDPAAAGNWMFGKY